MLGGMNTGSSKRAAARAALELLPDAGVLGLGSGSTARYFVEGVAELVREGRRFVGVATSKATRALAEQLGIPLLDDAGPWDILVCVDGADEVSPTLDLIKGGGGAHVREKIVNLASRRNLIVVDESKLVTTLGEHRPVPIEVLPFGHQQTARRLEAHGTVALRMAGSAPLISDAGNYIYDLATGPIADPPGLDRALGTIPGVVGTGLFCGRAHLVLVAGAAGVTKLQRG